MAIKLRQARNADGGSELTEAGTETYNVEVTDTFAGEANYSWVRRYTVQVKEGATNAAVMRAAKRAVGYNGVRGRSVWNGGIWGEFRPYGQAIVVIVTYVGA